MEGAALLLHLICTIGRAVPAAVGDQHMTELKALGSVQRCQHDAVADAALAPLLAHGA
jgi:hypothetical protein